jgi:glucan phosphoethanolaminetransferase (alkaline phosphatase superfamily)
MLVMVNVTLIVVLVLIVAIWLIIEFKRFRHKILAVFLIILVLFIYFSFVSVVKKNDIDLKTMDGIKEAGKFYLLWFGNAFKNVKVITANAVNLSWGLDENIVMNKTNETSELNESIY